MSDNNEPRRVPARKPGQANPAGQTNPSSSSSMKDRLLAERRAAEAAAAGGGPARPSAKPSASPARPAAAKPVAAHAAPPAARPAAAKPAPKPPARPATGASAARPTRPARATEEGADDEGAGRRRARREPPPKKEKSPLPYIATLLVIVGAVVAGYMYVNMGNEEPVAPDAGGQVAAADGAAVDPAATEPTEGATEDAAGETPADGTAAAAEPDVPAAPPELSAEEQAAIEATKALPSAKDPDSWNLIAITKNPNQVNDPNGVDLTKITPYGKPPGVDDAQWTALTADAKSMFDPNSGAKGTRAEASLLAAGLNAWPALTNEMLKLDPRRPDDNRTGKRAEMLLDKIRGGTTGQGFNWRMPATSDGELERKDLFYNLQLIVELHDVWRRHLAAPDRYFREKIAKGTVQEEMMGKTPEAEADELDLDKLDLSDLGGG
jgi:hypothetical protein